jgi:hypothetical protein
MAYLTSPSLSIAVPLAFGGFVALTSHHRPPLTPERRATLVQSALAVVVLSVGLVLLTPHKTFPDSWLNLWPIAVLAIIAVVSIRTENARLASAFYASIGFYLANVVLGLTLWQAILANVYGPS